MALYEDMIALDVVAPLRSNLDRNVVQIVLNDEGKPVIRFEPRNGADSPWVNTGILKDRKCGIWLDLYWTFYGFIPKECFSCFKVVFVPSSLEELYHVYQAQQELGWPSKCGMERRDYTHAEWCAFWYGARSEGLEGGKALFQEVKKSLMKHLGTGRVKAKIAMKQFFLKRGCTEMEAGAGPSDQWKYEGSRGEQLQKLLDEVIEYKPWPVGQPKWIQVHIIRQWVEWARKIGDATYKMFSEPESFLPAPVTYQEKDGPEIAVVREIGELKNVRH